MRRYYFHTEVLELRRSMIVLEKNTLLRVTYAIIVYTNTRLETVPIPSEVLFTTSSTFKIRTKFVLTNTNKITQMIILSHFRNKMATHVENAKLLSEKLPFLIANFHFWVKFRRNFFCFGIKLLFSTLKSQFLNHETIVFVLKWEFLRRLSQIKRVLYSKKSFSNEILIFSLIPFLF